MSENLKVILCIGETKKENKKKLTLRVLKNQLSQCLYNVKNLNKIIIAYEPIWSIGTGKIPSNKNLEKLIAFLRKYILWVLVLVYFWFSMEFLESYQNFLESLMFN